MAAASSGLPPTPLTPISPSSEFSFWLKREDQQLGFSAHIRGVYNRMIQVPAADRWRGLVFHGVHYGHYIKSIAMASRLLQIQVQIVTPWNMRPAEVQELRDLGCGVVTPEAIPTGTSWIDPLEDPYVLAGIGTSILEILHQLNTSPDLEAIFCADPAGGVLKALRLAIRQLVPHVRVFGVRLAPDGPVKDCSTDSCQTDATILVERDCVLRAIGEVFQTTRTVIDRDGALAVAGMKRYATEHGEGKFGAARHTTSLVAVTSSAEEIPLDSLYGCYGGIVASLPIRWSG
ncbi:hypothetical protein AbraIFM66951_005442 [Aspergillus brasiliensis]|uniref:Tryptophan synthase beta chain-like PALP domain-containing protein n=1 Tax=Aspergillus brasiliensis TaxID=319629 RepID=A0A9W5Z4Q0_9EURO|nr:hypothetical protein AbraCBS73388_004989 [Aspergillus brasiliensis]GKZ51295.1 hypothetical protein AbraIFM66951_005442 [Aspergillus brasiliensis]